MTSDVIGISLSIDVLGYMKNGKRDNIYKLRITAIIYASLYGYKFPQ